MKKVCAMLIISTFLMFFFNCKKTNDYLKQYPFFSKVDTCTESKTISLNNFDSVKNKNGFEYLLSLPTGKLIEKRHWLNNLINGIVFSYATNGKLKMSGNYRNDTLCDYLYVLDTITGNVLNYREKVKDSLVMVDNQYIVLKNGKVNFRHSKFYKVTHLHGNTYRISWFGKKDYPYMKIIVHETNKDEYIFEDMPDGVGIENGSNTSYDYTIKDPTCKFISGTMVNYGYMTDEEIKEYKLEPKSTIGLTMAFKKKIRD